MHFIYTLAASKNVIYVCPDIKLVLKGNPGIRIYILAKI